MSHQESSSQGSSIGMWTASFQTKYKYDFTLKLKKRTTIFSWSPECFQLQSCQNLLTSKKLAKKNWSMSLFLSLHWTVLNFSETKCTQEIFIRRDCRVQGMEEWKNNRKHWGWISKESDGGISLMPRAEHWLLIKFLPQLTGTTDKTSVLWAVGALYVWVCPEEKIHTHTHTYTHTHPHTYTHVSACVCVPTSILLCKHADLATPEDTLKFAVTMAVILPPHQTHRHRHTHTHTSTQSTQWASGET